MEMNKQKSKRKFGNIILKTQLRDALFIMMGVGMAAIGLKGFVLPNGFLDGGAMGVSLLIQRLTHIDLSYLILLVNLPFIIIGAKQISVEFAIKSVAAILLLSILVHFVNLPQVTSDKLLISLFGGFFLGAGIGLSIRGGGVIDGTEVMAVTISRKSSVTVGDFIAIFNVLLFIIAIVFIGIETSMYSMLTYLSASKTVDFIINGIEEYIGLFIVSENADEIQNQIVTQVGRGVTVLKSEKGYGKRGEFDSERKVLFCVVTRLEVTKLLLEIEKTDPHAFVVQHAVKDTKGGMIKKRPLH